jgi:hypothetical protein
MAERPLVALLLGVSTFVRLAHRHNQNVVEPVVQAAHVFAALGPELIEFYNRPQSCSLTRDGKLL